MIKGQKRLSGNHSKMFSIFRILMQKRSFEPFQFFKGFEGNFSYSKASMPPWTLITSYPCSVKNWQARAERIPDLQIT